MTKQSDIDAVLSEEQRQQAQFELKLTDIQEKAAKRGLEADLDIDLEENAPEPVNVLCRDYRLVALTDDKGNVIPDEHNKPRKKREYFNRTAVIETFVPTEILFSTVTLQNKLRTMVDNKASEAEWMKFYAERVLEVWKLTEPDMTYERLVSVLDFKKIRGLFARFFANLLGGVKV